MDVWLSTITRDTLGVIGIVSLLLSYLHFFRPNWVKKLDDIGKNTVIDTGKAIESHAKLFGLFYFIAGLALVYFGILWGR